MRKALIAAVALLLAVAAGAAGITAVAASRHSSFATRSAALEHTWAVDEAEGVPASSLAPLRSALDSSQYQASWWSPLWWTNTGQSLLDSLQRRTAAAWDAAMTSARDAADQELAAWQQMAAQLGPFLPAAATAQEAAWPAQIDSASTPNALWALTHQYTGAIAAATQQAKTAQLDAQVSAYNGVAGLLAQAQAADTIAQRDNLDAGAVPALLAQLQADVSQGQTPPQTVAQLVTALRALRSLISLNDTVAAGLRPVLLSVDQAAAESTPTSATFLAQYQTLASALRAASDAAQLTAVQQQTAALQAQVSQELSADACGHDVGSGKVITINLTLQEAVFYQDGCAVQATPVTTGRPLLRTPTGTFHVFYKTSPFEFISPWPPSSPFYYYPSWTSWVMEFDSGGYFIHDAPWEPNGEFGPGSENSGGASHGCVHIPTPTMRWLYQWTPLGTPVVITN